MAGADERGVSRRAFLIGAGGVLAAGAVGFEVLGPTRVLHKVGLAASPDHRVPTGGAPVRRSSFESAAMGGKVNWAMAAPAGARGVVVSLYGRGGNEMSPFDGLRLHDVVAAARAPLAVASVYGGADAYWHKRASGIDPLAMLHDEFLPLLDRELGRALPKAITGVSMGGYGALLAGERHPNRWQAVVASSPALWLEPGQSAPGAFDNAEDFRRNDVFASIGALRGMTVRVDCGTSDPFIKAARTFAARLPQPNLGGFSAGFHDGGYWRSVAPAQIATIVAALHVS